MSKAAIAAALWQRRVGVVIISIGSEAAAKYKCYQMAISYLYGFGIVIGVKRNGGSMSTSPSARLWQLSWRMAEQARQVWRQNEQRKDATDDA